MKKTPRRMKRCEKYVKNRLERKQNPKKRHGEREGEENKKKLKNRTTVEKTKTRPSWPMYTTHD